MPLNKAQKEAVEYLDGPLLVLAGPGTGKTQLLSSKVEYILKNTDANPENILCLTFTESGARNMRDRLFSMIGSAASKVQIHTYHAFGSTLLTEYKNYAEHFDRNLDAAIDNVTEYKILSEIQSTLDPFDILRHANISDLISTIASAKSARLDGKDLEKIALENIKDSEALNPKLDAILQNLEKGMKFEVGVSTIYLPIMEELKAYVSPEPICKHIEREANFLLQELNSLIETEHAKEGQTNPATGKPLKPSISPLTKWKDKRFEKDEDGNFRLSNRVANKKLLSLAKIMQQYEAYLETSGLYDFADMIQQAIKILSEDQGFKLTLEERFQYILLDEFQDTNAAQAEIIYRLTDYEKPCVMAVGDDDQAIFAFQGANSSNLLDYQVHYDAKVITLLENYRSQSEILETSYRIREQIDDSFARQQGIDKKLSAFKTGSAEISRHEFLESSAEYHWVAEQIADLIRSGVKQSDIAIITPKHKYVAPLLPYLKAYDFIKIAYEKRDNLFEDPRIAEILTLSRFIYELSIGKNPAHLLFEILSFPFLEIPALDAIRAVSRVPRKFSLDYLLESDSPALQDFAHFIADLAQKSAEAPLEQFLDYLIGTLPYAADKRSPFLKFYSADENSAATFELYENLSVLREAVLKHRVGVGEALNVFSKAACDNGSNRRVRPVTTGANSPEAEKKPFSASLHLCDLIAFVDDYAAANSPLVNTSPYQESSDSVQILTAHKSKGLEFEHVFIVATDDRAWGNAKGNNDMLVLPRNLISIRHTGNTEDERLRLFFVAITRAKSHLYLTNSVKDFSDKNPARLQYLAEYETEASSVDKALIPQIKSADASAATQHKIIISPYLPEKSRVVIQHYQNLPDDKKRSDLKTAWLANYQKLDGELKPLLLKRLENYHLTATDLTTFIDIAYAGPRAFYQQRVLRTPDESYSEALTFGNLIHATFEQVTNQKLSNADALAFYEQELSKATIPEEDLEDLRERGTGSLKASLKAFGHLLRDPNARAEVNFNHSHLALPTSQSALPSNSSSQPSPSQTAIPAIPLAGKIDHININPEKKTIEVYDFKTSGFKDKKWDSHPTLFKYKLQLGFYKLLLNLSPEYSKYKVEKGHILFVVPDSVDAKVHDKVYEFNAADEELLRSLIRAVYAHIRSLDFLENPELFVEPDAQKSVKDILNFISLMLDNRN